eukprot:5074988-Pleurochrysis_carterae.AAC.1
MLPFGVVGHNCASVHDTKASRRVRHDPVAVCVGDQLRPPCILNSIPSSAFCAMYASMRLA